MFKRRFMFYIIVLAVLFSAYTGYRFYENHVKPTQAGKAIQFEANEGLKSIDRAFLQRAEPVSQLPRKVAKQSPSLAPPVWTYTPEKWDSGAVDSVQATAPPTDVVDFYTVGMPNGQTYRAPLPKGQTLSAGKMINIYEGIYTTSHPIPPDPTPPDILMLPHPLPNFFEYATKIYTSRQLGISMAELEVKIANGEIIIESGEISVTQLEDWIQSVGGVGRAQALVEELGWPDSVPIDSVIIRSTFKAEPPPPPTVPDKHEPIIDDLPTIEASGNETPEADPDDKASEQ